MNALARFLGLDEEWTRYWVRPPSRPHVSKVLSELHLRDRVQAVVFAYEVGLAQPSG